MTVSASARFVAASSCGSKVMLNAPIESFWGQLLTLFPKAFTRFDSSDGFRNLFNQFGLLLGSIGTVLEFRVTEYLLGVCMGVYMCEFV